MEETLIRKLRMVMNRLLNTLLLFFLNEHATPLHNGILSLENVFPFP
jgi:hypothetical protein